LACSFATERVYYKRVKAWILLFWTARTSMNYDEINADEVLEEIATT